MSADADSLSPVRIAGNRDRAAIAATLARAFGEDPATSFIFPDPVLRAKRLPRLFALLFDEDVRGMRLVTAGGEAATLWRGPGRIRTTRLDLLREALPLLATFGTALGRALAVSDAIDAHLPQGDYWYLHIAGCEPAAQGKGFGGMAVRAGLERVAGSGLPAYLETPLERNIGFYQGLGFEVIGDWAVPKGGPRFWSMWRAA
ncbi:GNAT family N-acetyltransferase [Sphingomonas oligophenolica]|uniref:GNAT family N-acetyltransferase n=1 Tax=Sphingomonas oligophenolica TaxID=301154 RepID=A0ABU9XXI4_9SPHN